ncbi:hypothetical protein BJY04DRAFT_214620 [Aspergillus karnatakaensis]|uniref:uncharacterized protein n=1 Tax=Aspergillus karnatakaensis TaxID=1810916 RepID=UPI003CCD91ED
MFVDDIWHIISDHLCQPPTPIIYEREVLSELGYWRPNTIAQELPHLKDLISLSCACKWLRHLLAPRVFKKLYLRNTARSALSVQALAKESHAEFVKELHYMGICEQNQVLSPLGEVYPPEVDTVLCNLSRFPNLHHLSVGFPFDYDALFGDVFPQAFEDDPATVAKEEEQYAWRGLMAASYRAILSNYTTKTSPALPSLEINHFCPAAVSTFTTNDFHTFLSTLKSFTLTFAQLDAGEDWNIITLPVFEGFAASLAPWFFNRLSSLEEFTFDPRPSATMGDAGQTLGYDIGLHIANMPNLRTFSLANCFICPELTDFLHRHLPSLESVTLKHCYAFAGTYEDDSDLDLDLDPATDAPPENPPYHWHTLLTTLSHSKALRAFTLISQYAPEEILLPDTYEDVDDDLVARAQAKLNHENHLNDYDIIDCGDEVEGAEMAFLYGDVDERYGFRRPRTAACILSYLEGRDWGAYMAVMRRVERNEDGGRRKRKRERVSSGERDKIVRREWERDWEEQMERDGVRDWEWGELGGL